jgi:glutamine synthetase
MKGVASELTHGHYLKADLPQHGKVIAEYIWIDGTGINVRSKWRTLPGPVTDISEIPLWNYDGSSTEQAVTNDSEVTLKPVAIFPDPFRGGDNILVLCSTYKFANAEKDELKPANTNFRHFAEPIFEKAKDFHPWFGIEQEYTLFECTNAFTKWPLGWPQGGYPPAQGPYYCSVGATVCFGRVVMDLHYNACLAAKITVSGTNGETMPGQWEFQIGPWEGVDIGDHLWVARYLLGRVTEDLSIGVSFHPKPIIGGDWSGAGCHANYSTLAMREEGGLEEIYKAIDCLENTHVEHIKYYGSENNLRLTGKNETCSVSTFRAGVGDRGASIRIPTSTKQEGKGYFEDRRPASNIDPYVVGALLVSTTCLEGKHKDELMEHYDRWAEERKLID